MMKTKTPDKLQHKLKPAKVFSLYLKLGHHVKPQRWLMVGAALSMIGVTLIELLKPWPLKVIFDGILLANQKRGWLMDQLTHWMTSPDLLLVTMVGAIFGLAVIGGLFGYGQSYLLTVAGQRVMTSIRIELYSHIQKLSLSFHDERTTGDLMTRLTQDVQMMREFLVNSGMLMLARTMVVAGSLVVMLMMDWRMALVSLAVAPLLGLITWYFGNKIKLASRQLRKREGNLANVMSESISAIKVVQAYARESYEEARFARQTQEGSAASIKSSRLESHMERLVQIVLAIGTCAVVGFGVLRVKAGILTPGDLLVFIAYLAGLYRPIRKLSSTTSRMAKATVSGERILDILQLKPEVTDPPDAIPAPKLNGAVSFRNVSFAYGGGNPVLQKSNFHISPGETVALMSRSGSGKSTIANLLLRFYNPQSGTIHLDGTDIKKFTVESVRNEIAVVLQDTVLFNASIRDNIAYGKQDAVESEIIKAAQAASAHDFIIGLPDGYDTIVGERGGKLSGGQRQRISIARAFVRQASMLILDEPLTGLDKTNETIVRDALRRLMRGRTSIIITHDPDVAQMASRVFSISNGRIYEVATGVMPRIGFAS
jgi:ATP-binding cassette, subfamily B, bacterial